jgi:hypothetical protein
LKSLNNIKLLLLFLIILTTCSCEPRVSKQAQEIQLPLKTIIIEKWDSNLLELQELFPGGVLRRGSINKRIAASYFLKVKMPNINLSGNLNIHQSEKHINEANPTSLPVRVLRIPYNNQEELQNFSKAIKLFLKNEFSAGDKSNTIKGKEGYLIPFTSDDMSEGINVEIEIKERNNKSYIEFILQTYKFEE